MFFKFKIKVKLLELVELKKVNNQLKSTNDKIIFKS